MFEGVCVCEMQRPYHGTAMTATREAKRCGPHCPWADLRDAGRHCASQTVSRHYSGTRQCSLTHHARAAYHSMSTTILVAILSRRQVAAARPRLAADINLYICVLYNPTARSCWSRRWQEAQRSFHTALPPVQSALPEFSSFSSVFLFSPSPHPPHSQLPSHRMPNATRMRCS